MENFLNPTDDIKLDDLSENIFRNNRPEIQYTFDYEINKIYIQNNENNEPTLYDKQTKEPINLNNLNDKISKTPNGPSEGELNTNIIPNFSNIIKHLVSKKKHRIYNNLFDLDLSYITNHTLAMGYPSTGCESIYRNNINDIKSFLNRYHTNYKIYNLCLEENRIYNKNLFNGKEIAIFPFIDHEPCPIKLILEFCIDICLYLIRNPDGLCAIHCKAGKGRTGVMIVCYMIFSGLCNNSEQALKIFGKLRSVNSKGVTIPSQIRYIEYFEAFLSMNFSKPYIKNIPKILQNYYSNNIDVRNFNMKNILYNFIHDNNYFYSFNYFHLKSMKIGPFSNARNYNVVFGSIVKKKLDFPNAERKFERKSNENYFYYYMTFNSNEDINYDIKLQVSSFKFNFYTWVNLWYNTIENLSNYILDNDIININNNNNDTSRISNIGNLHRKSNASITEVMKQIEEMNNSTQATNENDEIDLDDNDKIDIDEIDTNIKPRNKNLTLYSTNSKNKIGKLIYNFSNDKDLNNFISGVNEIAEKKGLKQFDYNNLLIKLDLTQLDKFNDWFNSIEKNFGIEIIYSLLPNKKNF